MRNILVLGQSSFIADLEVTVLTEEIDDLEFGFATGIEQAVQLLDTGNWDEFIVFSGFLESLDLSSIEVPVTSYARNTAGLNAAAKEQVKSYGITNKASELLNNIRNRSFIEFKPSEAPETVPEAENEKQTGREDKTSQTLNSGVLRHDADKRNTEKQVQKSYFQAAPDLEETEEEQEENDIPEEPAERKSQVSKPVPKKQIAGDVRSRLKEIRQQKLAEEQETKDLEDSLPEIEHKNAQVITVYSAKGGVGKTTIACNLATFLSLTAAGRDHYRVAILDFNIEFGDVMSTLGFDSEKVCMSTWVSDIKEHINDGEEPDEICYSEREVRSFMQRSKDSGLYALLAPLSNEEAMEIGADEIRIMLRNTVEYGGFDFVVVDTGNNTRDAAVIPIEASDHVLMVLTQNVNTANCCYGFIRIMYELGYDMSKVKTVINEIRPGKAVGISVSELEEVLVNPSTGEPFTCIGKIDDDNDVRASVNDMTPLVYRSGHSYTKAVGQIASELIGEDHVLEEPKKRSGLLSRFHKSKG